MGCSGRKLSLVAAVFTLVEACVFTLASVVGLLTYNCVIDAWWDGFSKEHFANSDKCKEFSGNISSADETGHILIYSLTISLLRVIASLVLACGSSGTLSAISFYPWFLIEITTIVGDVVCVACFIMKITRVHDAMPPSAVILLVVIVIKIVLWIIHIVLLRLCHKSYLTREEGVLPSKQTTNEAEPAHYTNKSLVADHIRNMGIEPSLERENSFGEIKPARQQDHNYGQNVPPMTHPLVEDLRKRDGKSEWDISAPSGPIREEPQRWNSELLNHIKSADQYNVESQGREDASYNYDKQETYHIYQNKPQNSESSRGNMPYYDDPNNWNGRRNDAQNEKYEYRDNRGESSRRDYRSKPYDAHVDPRRLPQSYNENSWNSPRKDDSRQWNDDSYRDKRNTLPGLAWKRSTNGEGWEVSNDDDAPEKKAGSRRQRDRKTSKENYQQRIDENRGRLRREDSIKSDASSERSVEGKRSSNTTPPQGLHNQLPWSYVLPQINAALALKKKQLRPIKDNANDEEESPPVPVPDYTLHFNRQSERPSLSHTSSDAS